MSMNARWLSATIGLAFFAGYLTIGGLFCLRAPRAYRYLDEMFDADIPSRVNDLTHPQAVYERTAPHQFLVLLLNPFGFAIRQILRACGMGHLESDRLAATILCAAAGGGAVALFHRLLARLGLGRVSALLWTLLLGVSAAQVFFSCLPESYGFSALTLIALFLLATDAEMPLARVLAASAACVGMVVTNIAAVTLVRARWLDPRRPGAALRGVAGFFALFLTVAASLAALQHWIYPGTGRIVMTELSGTDRAAFVLPDDWTGIRQRARDLAFHFFLFDLAAPHIAVERGSVPPIRVDFVPPLAGALRGVGWAHAMLWLGLGAVAFVSASRTRVLAEPVIRLLLLWLAFCLALHAIFGPCIFLRSPQWTFAVIGIVATAVERFVADRPRWQRISLGSLSLLVALQVVDNAGFMSDLFHVFTRS